jgi:hypothetical protein
VPWLWELALKPEGGQGAAHRGVEAAGLAAERGRRSGPAAAVAWISRSRSWGGSSGLLDPEVRSVEVLRKYIGVKGGRSFNSDAKSYRRRVLPAERRRGTAGMSGAASLVLSSGMGGAGGVWDAN